MKRLSALAAAVAALSLGCTEEVTNPRPARLSADAVTFREAGATIRWNEIERNLLIKHQPSQNAALRQFAYLSVAQYNAVIAAENGKDQSTHPRGLAAVAGASAAVLTYFYPDEQATLDAQVNAHEADPRRPGERHTDFASGEAVGRAVGAEVIASARTDRFDAVWTGTIPVCPGCWHSNSPTLPPLLPLMGQMRPFFMTTGNQFRPAPPPAFGSPAFLAALAEIRHFSDTRTHEQDSIAKYWAFGTGTSLVAGFWNGFASDLIVQFHQNERKAAHTLALMNMAALDALIASHDAKYAYWLIRPTQADPLIALSIGLPNHPSYPSNHAAVSTTNALILGRIFPSESAQLAAMADQAGESRLYGGIHYRFDKTAGEGIAEQVARLALQLDVNGRAPFALKP